MDESKSQATSVKSEVGGDAAKWQAEAEKWKQKYWELKEKNANTMEKLINDKDELESESKAEMEKQNNRITELKKENEKLEQQVDALIEEKKRRATESSEAMTGDEKDKRIAVLEQEKAEMESQHLAAKKEQGSKVEALEAKVASLEAQLKKEKSGAKSSSEKKPKARSHRRDGGKGASKAAGGAKAGASAANSTELKYTEADMTELVNHIEELEDTLDTAQEKMVMQQFFDAMFGSLSQQKLSSSETIPAIEDFFSEMNESGYVDEVNVGKSSWKRLATSFTAVVDHTKTLSSVCYLFAFSLQFRRKVISVFSITEPVKPYVTELREAPNDYETKEDVFELANYMVSYAYDRLINTLYEVYFLFLFFLLFFCV